MQHKGARDGEGAGGVGRKREREREGGRACCWAGDAALGRWRRALRLLGVETEDRRKRTVSENERARERERERERENERADVKALGIDCSTVGWS